MVKTIWKYLMKNILNNYALFNMFTKCFFLFIRKTDPELLHGAIKRLMCCSIRENWMAITTGSPCDNKPNREHRENLIAITVGSHWYGMRNRKQQFLVSDKLVTPPFFSLRSKIKNTHADIHGANRHMGYRAPPSPLFAGNLRKRVTTRNPRSCCTANIR